jgi:hypothetical protein
MKAFRILLIMIVTTLTIAAQFEIVKDVTELPGDLTAQRYGYKDVNGQWCAIVKVHSDIEGILFEGMGYEKHDYKGEGIYLVYMQPDSKTLKFKKEDFVAYLHTFPLKLKPNTVYQIDIKSIGEEKKIEDIIITIQTVPSGGEIFFDGKNIGFLEQIETGVGAHEITIKRSGYEDKTTIIQVSAKNNFFKIELVPLPGTIQVNTVKSVDYSGSGMFFTLEPGISLGISEGADNVQMGESLAMPNVGAGLKVDIKLNDRIDAVVKMKLIRFGASGEGHEYEYYLTEQNFASAFLGMKVKLVKDFFIIGDSGVSRIFLKYKNQTGDEKQYDSWDFTYSFGAGYMYNKFDFIVNMSTIMTEYDNLNCIGFSLGYKFWMF